VPEIGLNFYARRGRKILVKRFISRMTEIPGIEKNSQN